MMVVSFVHKLHQVSVTTLENQKEGNGMVPTDLHLRVERPRYTDLRPFRAEIPEMDISGQCHASFSKPPPSWNLTSHPDLDVEREPLKGTL